MEVRRRKINRTPTYEMRKFCIVRTFIEVAIPFRLMGLDPDNLPEKIMGNFYKCADDTEFPHFVSWSPIQLNSKL